MKVQVLAIALMGLSALSAKASDTVLGFEGGIGVVPVTGVGADGAPTLNVVRGTPPAGPWRISKLEADVRADGTIAVKGRGLLIAAGNSIGTNVNASVRAVLFCGPATNSTVHSTSAAGVHLSPNGDFVIEDALTPTPPATCATPALLIVNANGGKWFAAGIPSNDTDD